MIVYSYFDRPQDELKYLAQSSSFIADAPTRLLHIGIFAMIICVINLMGFFYDTLLTQYVVSFKPALRRGRA